MERHDSGADVGRQGGHKMKRRKRFGVGSVALAGGLLVAALASSGATAGGSTLGAARGASKLKSAVTIGISLSLSGDFSADGLNFERGYELWQKYQNAHGGLLGHRIRLKILSDASSPTQVVTNYEDLISLDHVPLVLGPFSTLLTTPAQKVAHRFNYAFIAGAAGGPEAFASRYHDYFDVSVPIIGQLLPFAKWIAALPKNERPKTAAYPTSNDPFTQPMLPPAERIMRKAGIRTVYSKVFPAEVTDFTPIADAVAASHAQVVVLGSVDVPTVSAFMQAFEQAHYSPKVMIATAGPDQGTAFVKAVGKSNTGGIMVPNVWYPGRDNTLTHIMDKMYVAKYGGSASSISSDTAEAFSCGNVLAAAVAGTHSFSNPKIISYLHRSNVTIQTVQGAVHFNSIGQTFGATYVFQWQHGKFVQALPVGAPGSQKVIFPKPNWGHGG
ncbi:MAG: amino acid ABC transporter substrate-binding protein [Acidimicrobiales bacterium]